MREGDRHAFEQLFFAYVLPLTKLAFQYVQSSDIADDIVQDAFVSLWNEVQTNPFTQRPFIYLQMLVRRRSIDELRRAGAERRWQSAFAASETSPASSAPTPDALAILEQHELDTLIADAVAALPPRVRVVATLRWYERLSRTETAELLGVSVRTVDAQLVKAASTVRAFLRARGVMGSAVGEHPPEKD
jgi:RNA polymerase sigma-70 factor (ECF subfamily)